ncbi:hypothetical protein HY338_02500 [Candidatus Gottesmanbacteria bacterium]|nr:hypothetical protein [Candidatus Gottesmanbacteria bacterium]
MATVEDLEKEIESIKERNKKVETEKAWETSWTRRLLLALFTYLAISIYMSAISLPSPWLNGIVPSIAFLLSTLTLPLFRKLWQKYLRQR